jgi:hypothetical protein
MLDDPTLLRERLAEAGYLFFRGLLPPATVRAAGAAVLARLRGGGWTDAGGGRELFSRLLRSEPWWEPVPAGLDLRARAVLAADPPGPSRFFAIHPGWQAWRPPPSAVH